MENLLEFEMKVDETDEITSVRSESLENIEDELVLLDEPTEDSRETLNEIKYDVVSNKDLFNSNTIFWPEKYFYVKFNIKTNDGQLEHELIDTYNNKGKQETINENLYPAFIKFVKNIKSQGTLVLVINQNKNRIIILDLIVFSNRILNDFDYEYRLNSIQKYPEIVEYNEEFYNASEQPNGKLRVSFIKPMTFNNSSKTFLRKLNETGLKMTKYCIIDKAIRAVIGIITHKEKKIEYLLIADQKTTENGYIVHAIGKCKTKTLQNVDIAKQPHHKFTLPDVLKNNNDYDIGIYSYPSLVMTSVKYKIHPQLNLPVIEILEQKEFVENQDINLVKIELNNIKINEKYLHTLSKIDPLLMVLELSVEYNFTPIDFEMMQKSITSARKLSYKHTRQNVKNKEIQNKQISIKREKLSPVLYDAKKNPKRYIFTEQNINEVKAKIKRLCSVAMKRDWKSLENELRSKLAMNINLICEISLKNLKDKNLPELTQYYQQLIDFIQQHRSIAFEKAFKAKK